MKSGCRLQDGILGIIEHSIVAVSPPRKNGLPWFAKVEQIFPEKYLIRWLDCQEDAVHYYIASNTTDYITNDMIICSGVEFEPVFS